MYMNVLKASANLKVLQIDNNIFHVQSSRQETQFYRVSLNLQMCECVAGQGGRFCKHVCAVDKSFGNISIAPRLSMSDKVCLGKIALGQLAECNVEFFCDMRSTNDYINSNLNLTELPISSVSIGNDNLNQHESKSTSTQNSEQNEEYVKETNRFAINLNNLANLAKADDYALLPLLKKTNAKLERIKSTSQLGSFLADIGKRATLKRTIAVQPGSVSRRKNRQGFTKGARRVQGGRPSNFEILSGSKKVKKRKHNLNNSILKNVPNAKIH